MKPRGLEAANEKLAKLKKVTVRSALKNGSRLQKCTEVGGDYVEK